MCSPAAVPYLIAGSTALSAYSAYSQGQAASASADYQSQVAERNEEIQRQRVADAHIRGGIAARRFRDQVKGLEKTQTAHFAGQNIDVNSATVQDFLTNTRADGELDARIIENNALREAYGYEVDAENYRSQAAFARASGRYARQASYIGAGATLLSGGIDYIEYTRPSFFGG